MSQEHSGSEGGLADSCVCSEIGGIVLMTVLQVIYLMRSFRLIHE